MTLRISFLAGPLQANTANVALLDTATALSRRGHEVSVLAGDGPLRPRFDKAGLSVQTFRITGSFFRDIPRLGELRRALLTRSPQVIHVTHGRLSRHGAVLARLVKRPFVVSVGDPRSVTRIRSAWLTALLVPGRAARDRIASGAPATRDLLRVVPLGVDTARYPDPEEPLGNGRPIVGALASFVPESGLDTLIEAARLLLDEGRELHVLLSGHGNGGEGLRRRARELEISRHVTVASLPADLERVLATMDVFVRPSIEEWSGGEILQAMASARPVIASGVGHAFSLVREGETGHLVPRGVPLALAESIGRLLDSPKLAAKIGRAGRAVAEGSFPIDRTARDLEAVYFEAHEGGGG